MTDYEEFLSPDSELEEDVVGYLAEKKAKEGVGKIVLDQLVNQLGYESDEVLDEAGEYFEVENGIAVSLTRDGNAYANTLEIENQDSADPVDISGSQDLVDKFVEQTGGDSV